MGGVGNGVIDKLWSIWTGLVCVRMCLFQIQMDILARAML